MFNDSYERLINILGNVLIIRKNIKKNGMKHKNTDIVIMKLFELYFDDKVTDEKIDKILDEHGVMYSF